ncbi:MAG: winged helix-turn-helix transcriptional regulator [bacterium]
MKYKDLKYQLLQLLAQNKVSNQRLLAEKLGVSLGRVNAAVQEIRSEGLICDPESGSKDEGCKPAYILTQKGLSVRKKLAKECLSEKIDTLKQLEKEIIQLNQDLEIINES